jgi:hypothetical protein
MHHLDPEERNHLHEILGNSPEAWLVSARTLLRIATRVRTQLIGVAANLVVASSPTLRFAMLSWPSRHSRWHGCPKYVSRGNVRVQQHRGPMESKVTARAISQSSRDVSGATAPNGIPPRIRGTDSRRSVASREYRLHLRPPRPDHRRWPGSHPTGRRLPRHWPESRRSSRP